MNTLWFILGPPQIAIFMHLLIYMGLLNPLYLSGKKNYNRHSSSKSTKREAVRNRVHGGGGAGSKRLISKTSKYTRMSTKENTTPVNH